MKKRALAILFALVLIVNLVPMANAFAMGASEYVYTSNGKSLNMRDYPSKDANIIMSIPYGAIVDIYSGLNETWAHVYYQGFSGYVMTRYLVTDEPGPKPTNNNNNNTNSGSTSAAGLYSNFVACDYTATVRPSSPSGFVHLRWAPSKKQAVQRDYYAGVELNVIAENGTWCQVYDAANNVSGFMMKSFLIAR